MVPSGWEKHPVGKICSSIVPGRNKPKQFGGDIAWVTTPEITGKFIPSSVQENYISEETIKECGGKVVPKGAVVMAAVGDLGLIAITKEEVVLNQQLHAFVCSPKINNEFLAYWLATQTPYMESVASKTTILYLNKTNCESIPVLVPPILEQQKIANILSTWDKAISTTERLIENSTQQKKALMQQLLTGKKRLLDDNGERFEGEWEEVKLGDLKLDISDGNYSAKYPKQADFLDTGIPFLRANNLDKGTISDNDMRFISPKQHSEITKGHLKKGDILLSTRGELGNVALVPDRHIGSNINAQLVRINAKDKLSGKFLFQLFDYLRVTGKFESLSTGTALKQLPIGKLKILEFDLPLLIEEQQKIATVLTNADKEIELLEQQLADLQQEKKALMQVLLTGKKRVVVDEEDV